MDSTYFTDWKVVNEEAGNEDATRALRLRQVENALLSLRFDGQQAPPATVARLAAYVRGEMEWEEAFAEFYGVDPANEEAEQWARQAALGPRTDSQWQD